jgi:hypothetical protein
MVVNLIMRPSRLRSFANQTGPRRSETSGPADLSGTGQWVSHLTTDSGVQIVRFGTAPGGHVGNQVASHIRRISRTTSWSAVTVRDMSRRWPYASWRRHAERTGGSVNVTETPQR